ncbi:glycosyltransferase family 2 protein [Methylomonas sp. MED-D]|uniref:glycosyltransferase family 2 protein n=1 Tax=unclassified Methylomonas TaxID=2608980 RepID=UPI0028A54D4B|nr:glycosyltransferase family A protein [Methylomonas sp. MV1]MDT4330988.1 glycosyltransferase family A protein [Methylomonas sp. MV1]
MNTDLVQTAVIVPVWNASQHLDRLLPALANQSLQPDEWLVIDSHSTDDTVQRFVAAGARVETIPPGTFNHGGTRRWASQQVSADILIFMTQDAILADTESLRKLRDAVLLDVNVGVAYGRQLPRPEADIHEAHARYFNYPSRSRTKVLSDSASLGLKTCFSSDSFAAYRRTALEAVGGFPIDVIGSEDAYVAAKMLLAGWSVRYEADALVVHSHSYSLWQEFRRYFDIGVFYGQEDWIERQFGRARGEGRRFVISEVKHIIQLGQTWRIPECILRSALKLLGYRLGWIHKALPLALKRRISMFPRYWESLDLS